jgi:acyl-CoA thioester hydrolase
MQEAAFDASAAAGYDLTRYNALGRHWLIRETDLKVLHPLHYFDSVEVKTWVADFRRVRSRRAYELRRSDSSELVARAYTDWAFLDSETGRPAEIPTEMKAAFFPQGVPDSAPPRERFPSASSAPSSAFHTGRRVEWRDLDLAGHVNNAVYLAYIEECAAQAWSDCGWPPSRMKAQGVALVGKRHRIEYRQPAVLDDELEIATWQSDVLRTSVVRHCTMTRVSDGALVARARTLQEWVNRETGQPIPIPDTMLDTLERTLQ